MRPRDCWPDGFNYAQSDIGELEEAAGAERRRRESHIELTDSSEHPEFPIDLEPDALQLDIQPGRTTSR